MILVFQTVADFSFIDKLHLYVQRNLINAPRLSKFQASLKVPLNRNVPSPVAKTFAKRSKLLLGAAGAGGCGLAGTGGWMQMPGRSTQRRDFFHWYLMRGVRDRGKMFHKHICLMCYNFFLSLKLKHNHFFLL